MYQLVTDFEKEIIFIDNGKNIENLKKYVNSWYSNIIAMYKVNVVVVINNALNLR